MRSEVVWTALQWPSVEHVVLADADSPDEFAGGWMADGALVGVIDGHPVRLTYRLDVAGDGTVRNVDITDTAGGASLTLLGDGSGGWRDGAGAVVHALDGCIDVDISVTPLTNTLPIRRLRLAPGESAEIAVGYIAVPEFTVRSVIQRYTRRDEATYRYESGSFAADVTVDHDGVVTDYAALWRRSEIGPG